MALPMDVNHIVSLTTLPTNFPLVMALSEIVRFTFDLSTDCPSIRDEYDICKPSSSSPFCDYFLSLSLFDLSPFTVAFDHELNHHCQSSTAIAEHCHYVPGTL